MRIDDIPGNTERESVHDSALWGERIKAGESRTQLELELPRHVWYELLAWESGIGEHP